VWRFGFRRLSALRGHDDGHVRTRLRFLAILPGAVCLLAAALLSVAAVLPFLEAPTYGGLSGCCGPQTTQLVHSLLQGYDAGWVIVILLILGVAATSYLAGIRPQIAAVSCFGASVAALALTLFELSSGGSRVLTGGWGLPNTYGSSEDLTLDVGFYLFLGGAAVAIITSVIMVATSTEGRRPGPRPLSDPIRG
jgi:hypothetical protein